jgi:hypothetical protein
LVIGGSDDDDDNAICDNFPFRFVILFLRILREISIKAIVGKKPNATHMMDSNASIDRLFEVCK